MCYRRVYGTRLAYCNILYNYRAIFFCQVPWCTEYTISSLTHTQTYSLSLYLPLSRAISPHYLSVYLSIYLSIYLPMYIYIYIYIHVYIHQCTIQHHRLSPPVEDIACLVDCFSFAQALGISCSRLITAKLPTVCLQLLICQSSEDDYP